MEKYDLTSMSVLYTMTVSKTLFDQRDSGWVESEVVRMRSEFWKAESIVEKTFASHCSSSLFMLKFYLLKHLGSDLERFGRLSFTNAELIEHFKVLMKKPYEVISLRLLTILHESVENVRSTRDTVQGPCREVRGGGVGAFVL